MWGAWWQTGCPFEPGNIYSYGTTLIEDLLGLGGVADQVR